MVRKFNGESIDEICPTLGFNIKTMDFQARVPTGCLRNVLTAMQGYKLNLWDVGGQKSLRTYWRNYFEQTDALVCLFSPLPLHAPERGGAGVGGGLRRHAAAGRQQG